MNWPCRGYGFPSYSVSRLNEVQINFATNIIAFFGVQNLFCVFLECKIYFACFGVQNLFCVFWSAKFILRVLECKIYFACFGVQNLFCVFLGSKFRLFYVPNLFCVLTKKVIIKFITGYNAFGMIAFAIDFYSNLMG